MHDFEYIEGQFALAQILSSPAEAQGLLCGLLSLSERDVRQQWIAEFLDADVTAFPRDLQGALAELYTETSSSLEDSGFDFTPLLPDDKRPIVQRGQALCDWCQGFLYGLGLMGVNAEKELTKQGREALKDLTEITRMDVEAAEDNEENENAFAELEEFVKVAVLLIYEELAHKRQSH